jgi:hypothetical protein
VFGHYGEKMGFLREMGNNRDSTMLKNEGEMGGIEVYVRDTQGISGIKRGASWIG